MTKYRADPAVGLIGIGSAAPEQLLTNADLEKIVDTTDQWIVERTGIKILNGVGCTEVYHNFISNHPDDMRPGASGKP